MKIEAQWYHYEKKQNIIQGTKIPSTVNFNK